MSAARRCAWLCYASGYPHLPVVPLMTSFPRVLAGVLTILLATNPVGLVHAAGDEEVFDVAKHYTVKVRTQVELPFFGDRKGTSIGAGFVVDSQRGWIMSNAHVVSRSPSKVSVSFLGNGFVPAKKLFVDPYVDLAILEVDPKAHRRKLNAAQLDCRALPAIGHAVGAFGHPWDLSYTGTRGIISGVTSKFSGALEMLQTDAPINPGNSGGPLISLKTGMVVGVNTASRKSSQNTNFAVPMVQACRVLELLRAGRDPSPPELPVVFYKDVDESKQLRVAQVHAERDDMKLQVGDEIRGVEGEEESVESKGRLIHLLRGRLDQASLHVVRDDAAVTLTGRFAAAESVTRRRGAYASGLLVAATPWRDLGDLADTRLALMVHYVERGSAADAQKIESGDLLVAVDGQPVTELDDLQRRLKAAQAAKKEVKLRLLRLGDIEDGLFVYIERPLPVANLRLIGGQSE
jgi:serine protease Do